MPLDVVRLHRLAQRDFAAGDENVHGFHMRLLCDGFWIGAARKICGSAARTDGNGENDNPRGIHTLHFPHHAATEPSPWWDLTS